MKKLFKGNKYSYKILLFKLSQKRYYLDLKATDIRAKRTSFINTVNIVLSSLDILPQEMPRLCESDWILNKSQATRLTKSAERLFSGKEFLPRLESYLDFDREQSEWENYETT